MASLNTMEPKPPQPHNEKDPKPPNVAGFHRKRPTHSLGYRYLHPLRTSITCLVIVVLVTMGTAAALALIQFNYLIGKNKIPVVSPGKHNDNTRVDPNAGTTINLLVIGQDSREGDNAKISGDDGTDSDNHQADTTMVMQISADRSYINLVSIPRDSLVNVPSCQTTKGTLPARHNVMFNSIFADGWSAGGDLASAANCTLTAVNSLTGLDIEDFVIVDFKGLLDMIDAVGGVDICIPANIKDSYTELNLQKGLQHLNGMQATQYARMRHGTGTDGSDIMRTTRQQYLVKELVKQSLHKNVLTHSKQLYQLATTALKSLNISQSLADPGILVSLAMSLRKLDPKHLYTQTIPVETAPSDVNRVIWSQEANGIWSKLRDSKPLDKQKNSNESGSIGGSDSDASSGSNSNSASGSNGQNQSANANQPNDQLSEPDPNTGLSKDSGGNLIDPTSGGIVDPQDGSIHDPVTGQYIGIADRYVNVTICGIPAKS